MSSADSAEAIARGLVADAIWHEGRCTWVGPVPEARAGRIEHAVRPLGAELYGGTAGVGLVLAEVAAATGDAGCTRTAIGALKHSLARAVDLDPALRLGLFTGLPGIALAAARAGRLLGEEELMDGGRAVALGVRCDGASGEAYDVIAGRAGAIVGLLGVSTILGDRDLVDRAADLGHDVTAAAREHGRWSWPAVGPGTGVTPIGMGHGVSGVGWALMEIWAATGEISFRSAAEAAFADEGGRFDPRIGNWRRKRDGSRGPNTGTTAQEASVSWCHGAPGIGLARLRAWDLTSDEIRREELERAALVTGRWVEAALETGRGGFSLCHGLAGNAEMLRACARASRSGAAEMLRLADDVAEWGAERYLGPGRSWPDVDSPCLMTGLAGIARFYLGTCDPGLGSLLLLPTVT